MQKKGIRQPPAQPVPQSKPFGQTPKVIIQASRWAELFAGRLKNFFHPKTVTVTEEGIKTVIPESSFFSWVGEEELLAFSRVSSIIHKKGLLWDAVTIETLGGANTLDIDSLPKKAANKFVDIINHALSK